MQNHEEVSTMVSYTCVRDGSRGRANTFEGVLDKSLLVFMRR